MHKSLCKSLWLEDIGDYESLGKAMEMFQGGNLNLLSVVIVIRAMAYTISCEMKKCEVMKSCGDCASLRVYRRTERVSKLTAALPQI